MTNDQSPDSKPEEKKQPGELPEIEYSDLPESLIRAMDRAGWKELMPVQQKAMPYLLENRDAMVQARTGSGKTGAFVLPLIQKIDTSFPECQALILSPTRELARQVAHEATTLAGDDGLKVVAVYGGVGYKKQIEGFEQGAHIVVGTPGRILDHLLKRNLTLKHLKTLVFDEADRMLSIGFYPDMKELQTFVPRRGLNAVMFSATYPPQVLQLANEFLYKPFMLSLSGDHVHVANVEHVSYEVPSMGKERSLMRLMEMENPASAIIFCNTKANVHYVTEVLRQFGYDADELSADLSQAKREKVLARIRQGNLKFLVATDVAARGIDIPDLSHVILYDPPEDPESYIHRAGRTGRAGAGGTVVSLVDVIQRLEMKKLATKYSMDLQERDIPTDEDVAAVAGQRLLTLLEGQLRAKPPLKKERLSRFKGLARELGESEDGQELLAMLLDETYHQNLHAVAPQPGADKSTPSQAKSADSGRKRPPRKHGRGGRSRGRGKPPKE